MRKIILILILIIAVSVIIIRSSFLREQSNKIIPTVNITPTLKIDRWLSVSPTKMEIFKQRCKIYPNPTDVIKYNLPKTSKEYCATCGDGICDYIEKCLPSNPMTTDCNGGLFCQKDCK